MKRLFDFFVSLIGLLVLSPILILVMILIWVYDFHSPFYIAPRVGKNGRLFNMVKFRSMVINADKSGVDSTSSNDERITPIGHFVRKFKLDEFTQLWNVLTGSMSLVGPRPNVKRETDLYTKVEEKLLSVKPGITDLASIVFSDENDILKNHNDPDLGYNQLIRPWKSRLGIIYIEKRSMFMDLSLIYLTVIAIFSRETALSGIEKILKKINSPEDVINVSRRVEDLVPFSPPGAEDIVINRCAKQCI